MNVRLGTAALLYTEGGSVRSEPEATGAKDGLRSVAHSRAEPYLFGRHNFRAQSSLFCRYRLCTKDLLDDFEGVPSAILQDPETLGQANDLH